MRKKPHKYSPTAIVFREQKEDKVLSRITLGTTPLRIVSPFYVFCINVFGVQKFVTMQCRKEDREGGGFSNTGRMHSKLLLRLDFIGE